MQRVAIVGLPNVGKSTLFNQLTKRRSAIVSSIPHVTRDRKEGVADLCGLRFTVIDTGGMDDEATGLQCLVNDQVKLALNDVDVVLFVLDIKRGTDEKNTTFAKWLRKNTKQPVVVVVNKCESRKNDAHIDTFAYLDFRGPVFISAEHKLGLPDLYEAISPFLYESKKTPVPSRPITLAILGQPNVGKSTFVNSVLGEQRVITDSVAGTTRDAISAEYDYRGMRLLLTDTAGMRRKTRITENMEALSVKSSIDAMSKSNVVILMIDFTLGISQQDLSIASVAISSGKCMVIALNKSDLINDEQSETEILDAIKRESKVDFEVPIMKISALHKIGCNKVLDRALKLHNTASTRISTAKLNKWLGEAIEHHAPNMQNKRAVRLKYMSQVSSTPPTFVISTNTEKVDSTYQQYLKNSFTRHFSMQGIPIRMIFRKGSNPYLNKTNHKAAT